MVVPKPKQMAAGALAVMIGDGLTTTLTLAVFVQPFASVPVTI